VFSVTKPGKSDCY